jgi:hypothetical protein
VKCNAGFLKWSQCETHILQVCPDAVQAGRTAADLKDACKEAAENLPEEQQNLPPELPPSAVPKVHLMDVNNETFDLREYEGDDSSDEDHSEDVEDDDEDEPIPLTMEEIDALPTHYLSKAQASEAGSCPVCLEEYRRGQIVRRLPCMHFFHKRCIGPWLLRNGICPTCRCPAAEPA